MGDCRLKAAHTSHFASLDLYRRVMALLESYRYRLHVRRFIIDLFDKTVVENLVREGVPQSAEEARAWGGDGWGGDRGGGSCI